MTDEQEVLQLFIAETFELIDDIEPKLIGLVQSGETGRFPDEDLINAVFRLFHSVKGSAGSLGFQHIAEVTHAAETLLETFRGEHAAIANNHIALFLDTIDHLRLLLGQVEKVGKDTGLERSGRSLVNQLEQALQGSASRVSPPCPETSGLSERFVQEGLDLLDSVETNAIGLSRKPPNPLELLAEAFRALHSLKGNAGFLNLVDIEKLSHAAETILEPLQRSGTVPTPDDLMTILMAVDWLKEGVRDLANGGFGAIPGIERILTVIQSRLPKSPSTPLPEPSADPDRSLPRIGETVSQPPSSPSESMNPGAEAAGVADQKPVARRDIRVDLEKLDRLVNLIGELHIAESMVTHNPDLQGLELENFDRAAHNLRRITAEIQDTTMSLRMVPLSMTFQKLIRVVHDLSAKSGKRVRFEVLGEETEVDKTVTELISDPLVHIVRNAIDHGIESADERRQLKKPESGEVTVQARQEGGEVRIIVSDDGRGLDRKKILAKGIEKGLVLSDGQSLSDQEVFRLIFEPGLSTAEQVTEISGRGVGMDVVKRNIEKLKGRVDIESQPGRGSIVTLRIPLTMAIIEGMMIRVGDSRYTIPTLSIRESLRPAANHITRTPDQQELVRLRNDLIPILRLHEAFDRIPDQTSIGNGILVLVEEQDKQLALFADEILGQQQTVIKALPKYLQSSHGISGCTILGDGSVSLILDVGRLVETYGQSSIS